VLRCPACAKAAVVWGLRANSEQPDEGKEAAEKAFGGTCTACSRAFLAEELPLAAEYYYEHLMTQPGQAAAALQPKLLAELGGAHWTAGALMALRGEEEEEGKAEWARGAVRWLQLAVPGVPKLWQLKRFQLGRHLLACSSRRDCGLAVAGRRLLGESEDFLRAYWGSRDPDVQLMREELQQGSRLEVCSSCDAPGDLSECAACGVAVYCSKTCQKRAWPAHKPVCLYLRGLVDLRKAREFVAKQCRR
jgi:hypothetical protein